MHEVSIALGMIDELTRIADENKAIKITRIKLKIGKMSGIVTDSLKFAFDAVKLDVPLISSAEVFIEEVPLIYRCSGCNKVFDSDDMYFPTCPDCDSVELKILSGEEQHIENVEIEV